MQRTDRRRDALSKQRIVAAAIEILDTDGEAALTFRALAARLATGSGAIYWHVTDKDELLAATTSDIIAGIMADGVRDLAPREAIRAIALGLFDMIDRRPWIGATLSRQPSQLAMGQIFESIGQQVQALGVAERKQFDAASALLNFILGVAGQNAANARLMPPATDRKAHLAAIVARWSEDDPAGHPFVRQVASQMRDHDDREQFLAGVDIILAGIETR